MNSKLHIELDGVLYLLIASLPALCGIAGFFAGYLAH